MTERPIVLVVENDEKAPTYREALLAGGAAPDEILEITPANAGDRDFEAIGARAAGIFFCGGPDIDPNYYGQEPREDAGLEIDPGLDPIEFDLMRGAEAGRTPVLGVCRGMQLVNVHLGGTLYQDIQQELPGVTEHYHRVRLDYLAHEIEVIGDDLPVGELLTRKRPHTNSRHHQAVRDMGRGLTPVAYSPDGVLEVMQLEPDDWWLWAVQWHPENLLQDDQQRELFRCFVSETRRRVPDGGSGAEARGRPS